MINFNDKKVFKKIKAFTGFNSRSTSIDNLKVFEAMEGYVVSRFGEVWSLRNPDYPKCLGSTNKGYVECTLRLSDGEAKHVMLHRLVATYWCEGFSIEEGKIIVNHIDENPQNNHASNLEWVTHRQNIRHGTRTERALKTKYLINQQISTETPLCEVVNLIKTVYGKTGDTSGSTRSVALFTMKGKPYKVFPSIRQASEYAGVHHSTLFQRVKNNKLSKCGNYIWGYYCDNVDKKF